MTDHVYETHAGRQHDYPCPICDGGLAYCTVCRGGEAELPTDCPGVVMTEAQRAGVVTGTLDYRDGAWRKLRRGPI